MTDTGSLELESGEPVTMEWWAKALSGLAVLLLGFLAWKGGRYVSHPARTILCYWLVLALNGYGLRLFYSSI